MADDWFVPQGAPGGSTSDDDWIVPTKAPGEDVAAGMALRGIPVLGAYIPQAEAAIRAAAQPLTGVGEKGETFSERYAKNLPLREADYAAAEKARPITSEVLKLGGGTAALLPLGATALGARALGAAGPLVARVPAGAASGAAIAAADAAARGQDPLTGGVIGGALGGALPVVGAVGGRAIQGARDLINPAAATERLAGRMGRTAAIADDLTPAAIAARGAELGAAGTAADFGPNMRGLAQSIATQPGAGKRAVFDALEQRAAQSRDRVESAVTTALGPRQDVELLTRGEEAGRRAAADPLYEAWRSTRVHPTDEVKSLVPVLERNGLLNDARKLMDLEGRNTNVNFFTGGDRKAWPTTETFDYVKQAIDTRIAAAQRAGARNEVRIYTGVKRRLDQAIENSNPAAADVWRQAREAWANPTAIMEARNAGQEVFSTATRRDVLRGEIAAMSGPERTAFREGARDALADMMDRSIRGDANTRNMLLAPANQEKLHLVTGNPRRTADLIQRLQREVSFADTHHRVIGNSETAARLAMGEVTKAPAGSPLLDYVRNLDFSRPASWVGRGQALNAAEEMAGSRRQAQYEQARAILARRLMQQGPRAQQSLTDMLMPPPPTGSDFLQQLTAGAPSALGASAHRNLRGMADGGRPYEDEPIVVGERGPELFVPDRPGTVLPADDPWARAAAKTGHRGRAEGAGTKFVEGGYGVPSLYKMLDEGAQKAFESGGKLQHYGNEYYDPAPVVAQAIGAAGAPLVAPAMEGAVLGAGAIRRAAIPQASKQALKSADLPAPAIRAEDAPLFDYSRMREVPDVPQVDLERYHPPRGVSERTQKLAERANVERVNEVAKRGAEQGGIEWYNTEPLRHAFVAELGPEKGMSAYQQYLDLVASTSPRSNVGTNARNASYYYGLAQRGEPLPQPIAKGGALSIAEPLPSPYGHIAQGLHAQNAKNVLEAGGWPVLQNPKPASFAQNLAGNQMPVTVDTHNARLWGMTDTKGRPIDKPAKTEYEFMEKLQQAEAAKLGMTPAQYQASAWIGGGEQTGLKSGAEPFLKVLENRIRLTADKTGETPEQVLKRFIRGGNLPGGAGPLLGVGGVAGAEVLSRRD